MKAFRLVEPTRTDSSKCERPRAGPGEVVLKVGSASYCHSAITTVGLPRPFFELPVALGHELAGWIDELGPDVTGWDPGTAVAVPIIQGCGGYRWCVRGQDNRCVVWSRTPGVHYDGVWPSTSAYRHDSWWPSTASTWCRLRH